MTGIAGKNKREVQKTMEIEIDSVKAKTRTPSFEELSKKAKVTKEPPFYKSVGEALMAMQTEGITSDEEAASALEGPEAALREACQYYTNVLIPPDVQKPIQELPIIAVAANVVYRTLKKSILAGQFGAGADGFFRALDALSVKISGMSVSSKDGKTARKVNCRLGDDEKLTALWETLRGGDGIKKIEREAIKRDNDRLFKAIEAITGGRFGDKYVTWMAIIKGIADGDQKAIELIQALEDSEDSWIKRLGINDMSFPKGSGFVLLLALRRFVRQLESKCIDEPVFRLLEMVDVIANEDELVVAKDESEDCVEGNDGRGNQG